MIEIELKTVNELVKEGYEVTVDDSDIYIRNSKGDSVMPIYEFSILDIRVHRDEDGDIVTDDSDIVIPEEFIKELKTDELFTTELNNHKLVLNDDLTIEVGCEEIDKKKCLEIAKAIMKANGYDIVG